jgi:hypothetical protein
MIKILTLLILGVVLYRLLFPPTKIDRTGKRYKDEEYTDYEELD